VDIAFDLSGDVVERQELLNGTESVTLEGGSSDGAWAVSGLVSWNIGLESYAGEGDITLSRDDGAELFGTVVRAVVSDTSGADPGSAEAGFALRLEYEIDGGAGELAGASGTATGEGTLGEGTFTLRIRARLVLN
jgi:hypothetical protein